MSTRQHAGRDSRAKTGPIFIMGMVCIAVMLQAPGANGAEEAVNPEQVQARIRYAAMPDRISIRASSNVTVRSGDQSLVLPPGRWNIEASDLRPARKRVHVFPKTFGPEERQVLDAYLASWRARGYDPRVETFGLLLKTSSGRRLDNRRHWVSLARFDTEAEAQTLIERLKQESVWAWRRVEKATAGSARFVLSSERGERMGALPSPIEMACDAPIELLDAPSSYWQNRQSNWLLAAPLHVEPGLDGHVEVFGSLPVETYLRGVVPAEMPAGWHKEALKAQAIVARTEIYASLADKYRLEGFDFTALEGCRAYWGLGGHHPATDEVIMATPGQVLVHDNAFARTVFSACCGGLTEHNENVWSGPPNPVLRGGQDFPRDKRPPPMDIRAFLTSTPPAWCSADPNFRWQRRHTVAELSDIVNKRHRVGTIRAIKEGPRGVSGRLRSVTITGSAGTVTVERELAIRQAFGGLPSAMVIIDAAPSAASPTAFVFRGGGRGHGVGMCQYGARGMAEAGHTYDAILTQYFTGAVIERTR